MCHTKTVQAAMKKRRTHRSNRLSDSMPLYRPCNLSSSIVQSAKKEKSRGVFKEHELYSNSYGLKGRPHQLHPLLGCHRALEKRRWFLHLLSSESLFPPIVSPPPPFPRSVHICWTRRLMFESCMVTRKNENSVAEKNWNRVFFFLLTFTYTYSTLFLEKLVVSLSICAPTPPLTQH